MFEAGLSAASCSPAESVMVGDSELKDIEPARRLGMRAIRVAIDKPNSAATCAQMSVATLWQAQFVLHEWADCRPA